MKKRINTDDLIEQLASDVAPVRPLRPPWWRASTWLIGAAAYVAVLTVVVFEPWSAADVAGPRLVLPQIAAVLTAVAASVAAFASVVPGSRRRVLASPLLPALVWFGALLFGEPAAAAPVSGAYREWLCVVQIVLGAAPPSAALAVMLRRGAPLNPTVTAALAALAAGALANVGACFSHPHAYDAVTFVWHGSAILALVLLCAAGGPLVLRWSGDELHGGRAKA